MPRKTVPAAARLPSFFTIEFTVHVRKSENKKGAMTRMEVDVFAASPEDAVVALARKLHIDPEFTS